MNIDINRFIYYWKMINYFAKFDTKPKNVIYKLDKN